MPRQGDYRKPRRGEYAFLRPMMSRLACEEQLTVLLGRWQLLELYKPITTWLTGTMRKGKRTYPELNVTTGKRLADVLQAKYPEEYRELYHKLLRLEKPIVRLIRRIGEVRSELAALEAELARLQAEEPHWWRTPEQEPSGPT